jgi:hypothetical protein
VNARRSPAWILGNHSENQGANLFADPLPSSYLSDSGDPCPIQTKPHLAPLVLQNKKVIYDLLFHTSAETLLEVARDPQHLGAEIGFFSVLHTWSQQLEQNPHSGCLSLSSPSFSTNKGG